MAAMRVGIPREIKIGEGRVGLTPRGVRRLTTTNPAVQIFVEKEAGRNAGFTDKEYIRAGAKICETPQEVFDKADLIVKVKEPQMEEYSMITSDHTLFTFFHFAGVAGLLHAMVNRKATCIAYETVQHADGSYPLLAPMSKIAGEEAITQGARWLPHSLDLKTGTLVIIGGGTVGIAALNAAKSVGFVPSKIVVFDTNEKRLASIKAMYKVNTYPTRKDLLEAALEHAHIVVGAAYVTGKSAPKLVTREMLKSMPKNAIFVDVSIDQGGMTEESVPTTIHNPIIMYEHVKLYCVANMPGRVPERASIALTDATMPYIERLVTHGVDASVELCAELRKGLTVYKGKVVSSM